MTDEEKEKIKAAYKKAIEANGLLTEIYDMDVVNEDEIEGTLLQEARDSSLGLAVKLYYMHTGMDFNA